MGVAMTDSFVIPVYHYPGAENWVASYSILQMGYYGIFSY